MVPNTENFRHVSQKIEMDQIYVFYYSKSLIFIELILPLVLLFQNNNNNIYQF